MGGQGGCERKNEVFMKIIKTWGGGVRGGENSKKKNWGGGGSGRIGFGGQGGCERRIEVFVKIQTKCFFGWSGWGVKVDVNLELKWM